MRGESKEVVGRLVIDVDTVTVTVGVNDAEWGTRLI